MSSRANQVVEPVGGGRPAAHSHSHDGHNHGVSAETSRTRLTIALGLIVGLMAVEAVVGILVGSIALLADAAHMLTDAGSIMLALVAIRLAARPAAGALTYGLKRSEIMAAQANGLTLVVLAVLIVYEAIRRLIEPPAVSGGAVLIVALLGVVVNLVAVRVLSGAGRQSLNVEGAFQHILTDLYAFVATAIAGAVILTTGFRRADAIASLLIAFLMLRSATGLLRAAGRVFLEAAPEGVDPVAIGNMLAELDHVVEVHDLHVWEITSGFVALSAHVVVDHRVEREQILDEATRILHDDFHIAHTTLQIRRDPASGLKIHSPGCAEGAARREPLSGELH